MVAGDGHRPMDLTRNERDELVDVLDRIEPVDQDRGTLVYYNGDGVGPASETCLRPSASTLPHSIRTPDPVAGLKSPSTDDLGALRWPSSCSGTG